MRRLGVHARRTPRHACIDLCTPCVHLQGNPGRDYPHAVEAVVYVRPNCSAPFFTHEGIDLEWVDEDTEQANKRALLARPALDDPPPLDPVQADTEDFHPWPSQPAGGGTATADAEARGLDACAAARSLDGGSPSEAASLPKTYGSIMEAVEAAVPGTVIKLLAGRHLVSQYDRSGAKRWPDFAIRKSLQVRPSSAGCRASPPRPPLDGLKQCACPTHPHPTIRSTCAPRPAARPAITSGARTARLRPWHSRSAPVDPPRA
jgi:hypothetical protein